MRTMVLIFCLIVCCLVHEARSFCFMNRPEGNQDQCTYKDRVLSLDSTFTDYNECLEYRCTADGSLSVCGIGINAGVIAPPFGCKVVQGDRCQVKLVDANDETMECQPKTIG